MLFLNNAFTKDITEYDGEVLKEVKTVDGKIYLSNGAIIKEGVVGKFFDVSIDNLYGRGEERRSFEQQVVNHMRAIADSN